MITDKIIVRDGKVTNIVNIIEGDKWEFINNDPQIIITFDEPISGFSLKYNPKLKELDFLNAVVYYRNLDTNYSEEKKIEFQLSLFKETNHEIHFYDKVHEVRIDLHDSNRTIDVDSIEIKPLGLEDDLFTCLKKNINSNSNENKIVILSHDLSATGAPILAYNIASGLKQLGNNVIVLANNYTNSFLIDKYKAEDIPVIFLNDSKYNYSRAFYELNYNEVKYYNGIEYVRSILELLRQEGYSNIITNTVVGGQYVKFLKEYNFKIISLIHEMKTTINLYGFYDFGKDISKYSDYIVFPDLTVKNDFLTNYQCVNGESIIRPQGVYLNKDECKEQEETLFLEYGFNLDDFIIMNSGTCELRKGIDLFLSSAIILDNLNTNKRIQYVWTGDFGNNNELKGWVNSQLEKTNVKDRFHIIPFIKNQNLYKKLLSNVNIFWSTSREDPFPSVVLEALSYNIPVIGFKNAGGINTMLEDNRGVLIDDFNVYDMALVTHKFINGETLKLDFESVKTFLNNLKFKDYISFLVDLLDEKQLIYPKLDFYKWHIFNKKHYYQLQLPYKTEKQKYEQLDNAIKLEEKTRREYEQEIVLLDTSIGSDNLGDEIIMDYCQIICQKLLKTTLIHLPTHIYDPKSENIENNFKILCGTNLIYSDMEHCKQFAFPENISSMKNICLLGVGMQQIGLESEMTEYTKRLLKYILLPDVVHSVRDSETKKRLESIGIKNVLNTSCPTMWGLTKEHCKTIPTKKSNNVITTVTDYMKDYKNDYQMLSILKENYNKVYIWIQGQYDYEYLEELIDLNEYEIIPPTLKEFDKYLQRDDFDYIGTRLHAGIRCLNYGKRSVIIAIDNRAKAINEDTNLPIIIREEIQSELPKWIYSTAATEITIPTESISEWKKQFEKPIKKTNHKKKIKFLFKR